MTSVRAFLIAIALFGGLAESQASPMPVKPLHTSKSRFRIPFRCDPAEIQRLQAKEIRLYVSEDQGVRWEHRQSVAPDAGRFEFQTPADGEYWFAVRTLDGNNQLHPQEATVQPGLKVTVDSESPRLEIGLRQSEAGKIELTWNAEDPHIDVTKLRLEYIESGSDQWQAVTIVPRSSGRTTWSIPKGGTIAARGSVSDLAGNTGRAQSQVRITPATDIVPRPSVPDFRQPIAGDTGLPRIPFAALPGAPVIAPNRNNNLISGSSALRPDVTQPRYSQTTPRRQGSGRNRVVKSRKFQIGYKVDDVGPSGVSAVEFYVTQDNGTKWRKYGNDLDRKSPFQVEVPKDGVYGFALRVRSGVGLAADPPQPGEKPSIVISVDQSPPSVQLLPVQQGQGAALNQLQIHWKVTDDNPADKPIALYYAANQEGPWEPINGWQDNLGSYNWTVGAGVPTKLYIRVVARDAAGNVSRAETDRPIIVDLAKPSARIVDVETVASPGFQR
jgi:hypothetical protein